MRFCIRPIDEAATGGDAEAKLALGEARRLNPQLTIGWLTDNYRQLQTPTFSKILDGWRKAGLPEE